MRKQIFLLLLSLVLLATTHRTTAYPSQANISSPRSHNDIDNTPGRQTILAQWQDENNWPMAAANPERTSWTPEQPSGNLAPLWQKPFEPYIPRRVQIIAAYDLLYVSTSKGLYALDAATGDEEWVYPTQMPLGHSPTIHDGVAYVGGLDRKIHAVEALTGERIWTFTAGAGFQTNPLVVNGRVYAGSRDGVFYAIDASTGNGVWSYKTGGPILYSAAYRDGVIFFAANDSYAYALNAANGALVWKSDKLPGAGFYSWWPVVYENRVIFSGSNNYRTSIWPGAGAQFSTLEANDVYPNRENDPRGTLVGALGAAPGDWVNGAVTIDASAILEYFNEKPWRKTVLVLDRASGDEAEIAPVLWTGTHSGSRYPPVVGSDGVLYQQNNYMSDPYINGGQISGWQPGNTHISVVSSDWAAVDEPHAYAAGGDLIYWNLCCNRQSGAFDVTQPNTIFAQRWNDGIRPPTGNIDFTREGFLFGDLGDVMPPDYNFRFYMSDSGSTYATFAGPVSEPVNKNGIYGYHADNNPPIPYQGRLYMHRSNAVIAFAPDAGQIVTKPLAETVPVTDPPAPRGSDFLQGRLEAEVQKMLDAGHLRAAYTSHGIFDLRGEHQCGDWMSAYFHNPGETLYVLLQALPHLPPQMRSDVRAYLQSEFTNYPPYEYNHVGFGGAPRIAYDVPPDANLDEALEPEAFNHTFFNNGGWNNEGVWGRNPFSWYAMWKYAEEFGGAAAILEAGGDNFLQEFSSQPSDTVLINMPFVHNAYIAGYLGFLGLQELAGQAESSQVRNEVNRLLVLRADNFTADSAYAEFGWQNVFAYCRTLNVASNFLYLTPEVADVLRENVSGQVEDAVAMYAELAPYWFVSFSAEGFAENAINTLYDGYSLFAAQAMILERPAEELERYLDAPGFARGDLYYMQRLIWLLEAQTTPGFSLTAVPSGHIMNSGDTAVSTLTIQPSGGFSQTVTLFAGDPGPDVNVELEETTVTPPAQVLMTIDDQHPDDGQARQYTITVTGQHADLSAGATVSVLLNPQNVFLPLTMR